MMRWHGFGRGIAFAAVAAAAWCPWWLVVAPALGIRRALALFLTGTATVYVAGLGSSRRAGLATAAAVALGGAVLLTITHTTAEFAVGLAVLIAAARSGILYQSRPARALALEAALITGGLVFARFLATPTPLGAMLALWGFLLVQSLYFVVGGIKTAGAGPHRDPFDDAHDRAVVLLARTGI
jgi:hypothetical protein